MAQVLANASYRPVTLLQRSLLAVGSGVVCMFDPSRDDMISTFGETSNVFTLQNLHKRMRADPEGSLILQEKPFINTKNIDMGYLAKLPEISFGRHYYEFLKKENVTPDSRRPVMFIEDAELAFVMRRYREIHDLVHCVLGMPTNMLGEVPVKWFEAIQFGLPMCWFAGIFGSLRLGPKHTQHYLDHYLPWVLENATKSRLLLNVYFEKHFEEPIDELRASLNLTPPPPPPAKKAKN